MSLVRVQIPSPNSSSSRSRNQLLCIHTSEGSTSFRSLGNFLAQPSSQVSYQVGFDDSSSSQIGEFVSHNRKAWAAMNANDWGEHGCCCTPSGASAGWSRSTWLSKDRMLRACGQWLAEEGARYGIPMQKVDAAGIQSGRSGVCGHGDCSAAGAGGSHFDPGNAFPWDVVLGYATGTTPGPTPPSPTDDWQSQALIGNEWYPMGIFQSDADARQAAALTWWAQYLSRAPDATNLARWANTIVDKGYAGALNDFLAQPEVKDRMSKRPW